MRYLQIVLVSLVAALVVYSAAAQEVNLLALGEGALPVTVPPSYGSWPAVNLLDDAPTSGWASEKGRVANNVFVFEMAEPATIAAFEFDTKSIDGNGRGAKDVLVEVSATSKDAGFFPILSAALIDRKDGQRFVAAKKVEARWVRLRSGTISFPRALPHRA